MPPKRKSDVLLENDDASVAEPQVEGRVEGAESTKQPRVVDATDAPSASSSKAKKGKAKANDTDETKKPKHWSEVVLVGEDEVSDEHTYLTWLRAFRRDLDASMGHWLVTGS